jgi:hypothetical protein
VLDGRLDAIGCADAWPVDPCHDEAAPQRSPGSSEVASSPSVPTQTSGHRRDGPRDKLPSYLHRLDSLSGSRCARRLRLGGLRGVSRQSRSRYGASALEHSCRQRAPCSWARGGGTKSATWPGRLFPMQGYGTPTRRRGRSGMHMWRPRLACRIGGGTRSTGVLARAVQQRVEADKARER